jgi:hypothetical protein
MTTQLPALPAYGDDVVIRARFVPCADVTLSHIGVAVRLSFDIELSSVADTRCTAVGRFLHRDPLPLFKELIRRVTNCSI